ncbi:MAG: 2-amino-4-hydroxy-6-hydroxymethyldihydropteridin epyrophosphokinae, partial [Thermomicrobiales bacterium]|nr:2-amino-4-hydroxy-6-hydroxymethyldihydropteridin epyrophosphokinae [Thermomicrobiales bacterium]
GSNLGDRLTTLRMAIKQLETLGRIAGVSSLYQTEPVGYLEQPRFLNAVVALDTALAPDDLLLALLGIERNQGRMRSIPNAPRTLDLDLLMVDNVIREKAELTLPHPRLHERAFVLVPLAEIAPELVHPGFEKTMPQLLRALADQSGVEVYAAAGWESGRD